MIIVESIYSLSATIQGKDIIDYVGFKYLQIIENTGTELPTANVSFNTADKDLIQYMTEQNIITLTMGNDTTNIISGDFLIFNPIIVKTSSDLWEITLSLILSKASDWQTCSSNLSDTKESSIQRITNLVSEYKVNCNIDLSSSEDKKILTDNMIWFQNGVSLKKHIEDVWYHSYLRNGEDCLLLAPGIEEFKIFSLNKIIEGDYKYILSSENSAGDPKVVRYDNSKYHNMQGTVNALGARGVNMYVMNLTTGDTDYLEKNPKVWLGNNPIPLNSQLFNPVELPTQVLSRNQHKNYWQAYINNMVDIMFNSSFMAECVFTGYVPLDLLDYVIFKEIDIQTRDAESAEYSSNLGLITKISRLIKSERLSTVVEVSFATPDTKIA